VGGKGRHSTRRRLKKLLAKSQWGKRVGMDGQPRQKEGKEKGKESIIKMYRDCKPEKGEGRGNNKDDGKKKKHPHAWGKKRKKEKSTVIKITKTSKTHGPDRRAHGRGGTKRGKCGERKNYLRRGKKKQE